MKTLVLTITILIGIFKSVHSQGLEGIIVYKNTVENPHPENLPDSVFKMMFKDTDTTTILYIKHNRYKLVTLNIENNQPRTITLYNPDSTRLYQYMGDNTDFCMSSGVESELNPKITRNKDDNTVILGKECHSITIDYGNRQTRVYFSDDFKVDTSQLKNDPYGFLLYILETGTLPLKIVMSGGGAVHNIVFTALEVNQNEIDDSVFELPKFKKIMNMSF